MSSVKRTIVGTRSAGSPLSPAVRYGDLLFVSGQTAADLSDSRLKRTRS